MTLAPNSLQARDIAYMIHPYTNLRQHERQGPLVITGGDGVFVIDDDGKRYLEGLAGLWCTGLGFSEKRLAEAARRQMEQLPYIQNFAHRSSNPLIELSERLIGMAPAPLAKAYFVNSGSEAIDTAIKLIWYYQNARGLPEKKKLIARQRGYHGITIAAGHLTGSLAYTSGGFDLPMMDRFRHVTAPNLYRYGLPGETEAQFQHTLDALTEIQFDVVHIAAYSTRTGTPAAIYHDQLPLEEKKRRVHEVERVQKEIQTARNAVFLGKTLEVLIEGQSKGKWYGRTRNNKLLHIASEQHLAGQLVEAKVTHTSPWSLQGDLERIIPTLPQPVLSEYEDAEDTGEMAVVAAPPSRTGSWLTLPMV